MKYKKFNLIEIALAIAILAVGLTAIVSLFPMGFQEMRDSIGESYSSEVADSMFAYIAREAYDENTWDSLFVTDGGSIPASKPTVPGDSTMNPGDWGEAVDANSQWMEGNIFKPTGSSDGIYGLKLMSGDDSSIADFTGEVLLWKSQMENVWADGEFLDPALSYNEAVVLQLEISWPVEKPYDKRRKNTYYFELFNYNQ